MWFEGLKKKTRRGRSFRRTNRPAFLRLDTPSRDTGKIRKRLTRALMLLAGLASAVTLIWLGVQLMGRALFSRNELFRITECHIECKGKVITPAHVSEYAELSGCSNLFDLNIKQMRDHLLEMVPRLKDVEITRRLPGVLTICAIERMPMARLNMEGYYLTVDKEGYVLGPSSASRILPVINGHCMPGLKPGVFLGGTAVMNALEVLDVCETTPIGHALRIMSLDVRDRESLEFHLIEGENVKLAWKHMGDQSLLSRECLEKKLGKLVNCLRKSKALGEHIESIDMTLENNFPAQYD